MGHGGSHRAAAVTAAAAAALFLASTASAADPPLSPFDPSRVQKAPSPPASAPLTPPVPPAVVNPEDTKGRFVLQRAVFDGAQAVPQSALAPAWSGFAGKPVSLVDLRAIGRRAEALYASHGFPFVAVRLPVQQVQDGVVHFAVVEGHISDLTVLGSDPVARRQATEMLEPIVNKSPLALDEVETAYQLAKRVPGLSISGTLRQGTESGGMDLVVAARRQEPLNIYVNVNNLYADNVGPWGVLVGADYFGQSAYGDELSLVLYDSLPDSRQTLFHGSYSRFLDSWGTQAELSGLWGVASPTTGGSTPLVLATNIAAIRLEVSQPILERHDENAVVDFAFYGNDQKTQLSPTLPISDDKLRDFSATLSGEQIEALGRWSGSITLQQGLSFLGASQEHDPDLSRPNGDPQATVLKVSFEAQSATWKLLSVAFRSDLQFAAAPLLAPDQYAFGNLAIGRGYQPGIALSDDVIAASVEGRLGPFHLTKIYSQLAAQPFVFVDTGRLHDVGGGSYSLTSVGGGVRFQIAGKVQLDLVYADPLDGVPGTRRPPPTLLLNLTFGLNDIYSAIHRHIAAETGK